MNFSPLTEEQIQGLFVKLGLGSPRTITKIAVGFSNDVYDIDDQYILKSSKTLEDDEIDLRKEIYLCKLLKDVVPAPTIVHADASRTALDRVFIIYKKIHGDNLLVRWHEYTNEERKSIIKQICGFIRAIAAQPHDEFVSLFGLRVPTDWEQFIVSRITETIEKVKAEQSLPPDLETAIRTYVSKHSGVLTESKLALLYVDPHFDNFIVRDAQIVGMLDFESSNVRSIDWVLHLVQRMQNEPAKYVSEAMEESIVPEHYTHLMEWYREFYPELFDFPDMDTRLRLYAIKHNLTDLVGWPHVESLRQNLRKAVSA